jgi:hypothetical protein
MPQHMEMDSILESELDEGERILWSGRPDPNSKSINMLSRVFVILSVVFGIVAVAVSIALIVLAAVSRGGNITPAVFIPLITVASAFLFMTILFAIFALVFRLPLRETVYAITDRRILILTSGSTLSIHSYSKADIGHLSRIERPDGTGDLIFAVPRVSNVYGYGYGMHSSGAYGTGMYDPGLSSASRFIGISNVRAVEQLVRRTFK